MTHTDDEDTWSPAELREIERINKLAVNPEAHLDTFKSGNSRRDFNILIVMLVRDMRPSRRLLPATYREIIRIETARVNQFKKDLEAMRKRFTGSKKQWRKAAVKIENHIVDWHQGRKELERHLDAVEALPPDELAATMKAWWANVIWPTVLAYGRVPSNQLGLPDWQAASNPLTTVTSEQSVRRLFNHGIARGAFRSGPASDYPHADYPNTDISGRLGTATIQALAELRPDETMLGTDAGAEAMKLMAERLSDPALGFGIHVQRAARALEHFYRKQRQTDGSTNITISELADFMEFKRNADGQHHPDSYTAAREAVRGLVPITIQMIAQSGRKLNIRQTERAFTAWKYWDAPDESGKRGELNWIGLSFRLSDYLTHAFAPTAQFMGIDQKLNQLHAQREHRISWLADYVQENLRINKTQYCEIRRSVKELLTAGMHYNGKEIEAPSRGRELMEALATALDKLEEMGTVKHWQGDATWAATRELLEAEPGKRRLTKTHWRPTLYDAIITIEGGPAYFDLYKRRGLTLKGKANPLLEELRAYCGRRGANARVAEDLDIGADTLTDILAGKVTMSATVRERAVRLMTEAKAHETLPLPFDSPTPGD